MSLKAEVDMGSSLFERMEQFVSSSSTCLSSLWAKSGDDSGWLSLPQHLADSACVASLLWGRWVSPSLKRYLSDKLGMDEGDVATLVVFLAGVHDVGKATRVFQRQIEARDSGRLIVDGIAATGLTLELSRLENGPIRFPHGLAGEALLFQWLKGKGLGKRAALGLASVVGAHHGIASSGADLQAAERVLKGYPDDWRALHSEILDGIASASGFDDVLDRLPAKFTADSTMLLTGLVVMSDWIASNAEAFPMVAVGEMVERARNGFESVDLTGPWNAENSPAGTADEFYRRSFGWPSAYRARPIQRAALDAISDARGPCLMIIEAPTGEGKTEAALAVGQAIAAATGAQGLLLATPTMGTSNGLFPRALEWAARNTPGDRVTSMNLVHSRRIFSEDFHRFRSSGIAVDSREGHGSVVASQWFNGPKKALLSNFVVCTVDQVLLMALQMRHSMLRHIGIAGKVIIVDEVHSYDLYMGSYLKAALRWLARYNVSVILLSATLPRKTKLDLVTAYEFRDNPPVELSAAYPLVTVSDGHGIREIEVESRPTDMEATIRVVEDSLEELSSLVHDLFSDGGCILIICNTVRRAQETYRMLSEEFPEVVELHHSAFMASERSAKEDALRQALGPDSHRGAGRPVRKIIVSTQVAEQSLDIDADALITDIAPMDLLIQRIGRIHRHSRPVEDRPENLRDAKVFIRGIEQVDPVPVFEGGSAAVYEPAVLMATLANLPFIFRRPDDVSHLVQATYAPEFTPPAAWVESYALEHRKMREAQQRSERRAQSFQVPTPKNSGNLGRMFERYHQDLEKSLAGEEAGLAQVRDTDPTFEVIPIITTDYGYRVVPLPSDNDVGVELSDDAEPDYRTAFRLASSVIRLPARFSRHDAVFDRVIGTLEMETPVGWASHYLLKGQVALRLDERGEVELDGQLLRYSSEFGLEQIPGSNRQGVNQ